MSWEKQQRCHDFLKQYEGRYTVSCGSNIVVGKGAKVNIDAYAGLISGLDEMPYEMQPELSELAKTAKLELNLPDSVDLEKRLMDNGIFTVDALREKLSGPDADCIATVVAIKFRALLGL
jgi:hypothetical protein